MLCGVTAAVLYNLGEPLQLEEVREGVCKGDESDGFDECSGGQLS